MYYEFVSKIKLIFRKIRFLELRLTNPKSKQHDNLLALFWLLFPVGVMVASPPLLKVIDLCHYKPGS